MTDCCIVCLCDRASKLEAENKRLREALERADSVIDKVIEINGTSPALSFAHASIKQALDEIVRYADPEDLKFEGEE